MLFPILGPSSLPVLVAQSDERHANRTASVLECMTDTEHTTSGSNEEEYGSYCIKYSVETKLRLQHC